MFDRTDVYIVVVVICVFILTIIVILSLCIFCIFRYHYKEEESHLGIILRRTFSRPSSPSDVSYYSVIAPYESGANTVPTAIGSNNIQHHPGIGDSPPCESDLPLTLAEREARIVLEGNNLVHPAQASCPPSQETGLHLQENVSYQPSTKFTLATNLAYGADIAIAPEVETERNMAYECNVCGNYHFHHYDRVMQGGEDLTDQLSTADVTSTTYSSVILPCPIVMNLPGARMETTV